MNLIIRISLEIYGRISGMFIFPIIASELGSDGYGTYSLVMTLIGLFVPLASMGLGYSIVRHANLKTDSLLASIFINNAILVVFSISLAIIMVLIILSSPISNYVFKNSEFDKLIIISSFCILTTSFINIINELFRSNGLIKIVSIFQFVNLSFVLLILYFLAKYKIGLLSIFTGLVILQTIYSFTGIMFLKNKNIIKINLKYINVVDIRKIFKFGYPVVISGVFYWIITSSDRFFLGYYYDATTVGAYSAIFLLALIPMGIAAPFWFLMYPKMASVNLNIEKNESISRVYLRSYMFFGVPAIFGLLLLSDDIIFEFSRGNIEIDRISAFFVIGAFCFDIFTSSSHYILMLKGDTHYIKKILALSCVFSLLLNLILTPKLGILGAALSFFISYGVNYSLTLNKTLSYGYKIYRLYDIPSFIRIVLSSILMCFLLILLKDFTILYEKILIGIVSYVLFILIIFNFKYKILLSYLKIS